MYGITPFYSVHLTQIIAFIWLDHITGLSSKTANIAHTIMTDSACKTVTFSHNVSNFLDNPSNKSPLTLGKTVSQLSPKQFINTVNIVSFTIQAPIFLSGKT